LDWYLEEVLLEYRYFVVVIITELINIYTTYMTIRNLFSLFTTLRGIFADQVMFLAQMQQPGNRISTPNQSSQILAVGRLVLSDEYNRVFLGYDIAPV
jgi:hypothetical protein